MYNWKKVKIGDVAEVYDGPHATPRTVDSGPIFLGIGALNKGRINLDETRRVTEDDFRIWTRRVTPQPDDVVFSYETRLGEAAIIPEGLKCCLGRRMGLVRTDRKVLDPRFFLYLYISPEYQSFIQSRTNYGATVDRIALKEFPSFEIPLPPIEEQRAISKLLGSLDDKLELNRKMNETLESMARAIFKDWFVDFGPTRAKMAGTKPYLAPDIWKLFPENLDDEGKPEGWKYETLRSLCLAIENGGTPSRTEASYWSGGTIPWLTSSEVRKPIVLQTAQFLTSEGLKNSSAKLWPSGTTVVAMYGATAGEVCLLGNMISSNQACCGLIPRPSFREYLFISVREAREELASKAVGSAQQNLSQNLVSSNRSLLPTDQVVSAYSSLVGPMLDRWIANEGEAETLAATRDLVLPKLMSGEIRVKEAAKKVEAELELHL